MLKNGLKGLIVGIVVLIFSLNSFAQDELANQKDSKTKKAEIAGQLTNIIGGLEKNIAEFQKALENAKDNAKNAKESFNNLISRYNAAMAKLSPKSEIAKTLDGFIARISESIAYCDEKYQNTQQVRWVELKEEYEMVNADLVKQRSAMMISKEKIEVHIKTIEEESDYMVKLIELGALQKVDKAMQEFSVKLETMDKELEALLGSMDLPKDNESGGGGG